MGVIVIENLTKCYGSDRGIENIDLTVSEGEVFGFIGPNGAGKSTTIRTLVNLIFPTSGSAQIFGMDVVKDTKIIKNRIGYLSSDVNYYNNMKVQEFLDYSATFYPAADVTYRKKLVELLSIDESRELNELSYGNKKKVAIVQCLMHRPELLIMDEPTNGLDPLMQAEFHNAVEVAHKEGATVFLSSHILSEVQRFCNRVSIIRDGKIVTTEKISELLVKQLKKVNAVFDVNQKETLQKASGVSDLTWINDRAEFSYIGGPQELILLLQNTGAKDFTVTEPSLEDIFMHYYE